MASATSAVRDRSRRASVMPYAMPQKQHQGMGFGHNTPNLLLPLKESRGI